MSLSIYVFCTSRMQISKADLVQSIRKEKAFESAEIVDTVKREEDQGSGWKDVHVRYDRKKKPVFFHYYGFGRNLAEIVADIIDEDLRTECGPEKQPVVKRLRGATQAVVIELDPASISDYVWEAIDCIEAYLAFKYEGIVYVPHEGFYDEGLDLICSVAP